MTDKFEGRTFSREQCLSWLEKVEVNSKKWGRKKTEKVVQESEVTNRKWSARN